jgi:hypothetical protein
MARPKKQVKLKEPIKIRLKSLADGNKSIYLDIYWKGVRKYEYLKLYLIPETNPINKEQNKETMAVAERIKASKTGILSSKVQCSLLHGSRSTVKAVLPPRSLRFTAVLKCSTL